MWIRIAQEGQIGEHLDRAVGDVPGKKGVFEGAVLEFQQDSTFFGLLGLHMGYSRNAGFQLFLDLAKNGGMVVMKIFHDKRQVFAFPRQVLRVPGLLFGSGAIDVEVGYEPPFDQIAQGDYGGKSLELSQSLDGQ